VDCLDRTNIAQAAVSLLVLEEQIEDLLNFAQAPVPGPSGIKTPSISLNMPVQEAVFNIWEELGNIIALDYTGTNAHSIESKDKAKVLIKRYISNLYSDTNKQKYMNLLQNCAEQYDNRFKLNPQFTTQQFEWTSKNPDDFMTSLYPVLKDCDLLDGGKYLLDNTWLPPVPLTSVGELQALTISGLRTASSNKEMRVTKMDPSQSKVRRFSIESDRSTRLHKTDYSSQTGEYRKSVTLQLDIESVDPSSHVRARRPSKESSEPRVPRRRRLENFDLDDVSGIQLINPDEYYGPQAPGSPKERRTSRHRRCNKKEEFIKIKHMILDGQNTEDPDPSPARSFDELIPKESRWQRSETKIKQFSKLMSLAGSLCIDPGLINQLQ
jgi:hypothetical protein